MCDESKYRLSYIESTRSCYHNHSEAFVYYEQLEDHLDSGSERPHSSLQTTRAFELITSPVSRYPIHSLFVLITDDSPISGLRIVIVERFPSSECIASLGARWSIRPEFFIDHLF
jgi:hypothetical protein